MKTSTAIGLLMLAYMVGCNTEAPGERELATASISTTPVSTTNTVHFEGVWQGTMTSRLTNTSSSAITMVNGWGELRLLTDDIQFVGFPLRTATTVSGSVTGIRSAGTEWQDGSTTGIFSLKGEILEDEFIEATYEGGSDAGELALAWSAAIQDTSIGSIIGQWVQNDENGNILASLTIAGVGIVEASIHGSHANGCTFSGRTEAWTSYYSYDVVPFEVSGCPLIEGVDLNGAYSGTAALIDLFGDESDKLVLVVALSNDDGHQISFYLHRIPA